MLQMMCCHHKVSCFLILNVVIIKITVKFVGIITIYFVVYFMFEITKYTEIFSLCKWFTVYK